jgi:hypothetical protein
MFHRTASLKTTLGEEEVCSFVEGLVGEDASRPFLGSADRHGFTIKEIKAYRSSFLPRVTGRYVKQSGDLIISLSLRPHREVVFFLLLWGTFLFLVSAMIIVFALSSHPWKLSFLGAPLALAALTYTLTYRVFTKDCHWALQSLKEQLAPCLPA